jgi:hypothetical protein
MLSPKLSEMRTSGISNPENEQNIFYCTRLKKDKQQVAELLWSRVVTFFRENVTYYKGLISQK